jgi:RecA-family ATPase
MDLIDRARSYVSKCPPAVSGQNGHATTFNVAVALMHGFALSEADAWPIFSDYNHTCSPPWSESELRHKLQSALTTPHAKPRGFLLGTTGSASRNGSSRSMQSVTSQPKLVAPKFDVPDTLEVPAPMTDGARALLRSCFLPGDAVRIVSATLNDEGLEIPEGVGPILPRDEWLRKLDSADGNPNSIWKKNERTGIYIGLNPLKPGSRAKDDDVTAYRHALIEFDSLPIDEQWNIYSQSNLPCSAVIYSGGKSLHAWVRVDAKDKSEYEQRVRTLFDYFAAYGLDPKNRNPARLSRLPNCIRFDKRQELFALNIGTPSFTQWLADREIASIGEQFSIESLVDFKPADDPDCLLGRRWLGRGSSCLVVAQSGVGKSSLAIQAAVTWAFGRAFFGIQPCKELTSLIVQNENDKGDVAEMLQGVMQGLGIEATPDNLKVIRERVIIIRDTTHTGAAFLNVLQRLVERHRPDLGWIDPLYTYIGDDISSQKVCSDFLCQGLGPITKASGVCWMFMHHPGKPSTDSKARKNWTTTDYSYFGLGSSTITNWIRATMTLLKMDEEFYQLMLGKRGKRAMARDTAGQPTTRVFLKHSDKGIFWEQVEPPPEKEKKAGPRSGAAGRPKAAFGIDDFIAEIRSEHLTKRQLFARAVEFGDVSRTKFYGEIMPMLHDRLDYDAEHETYSTAPTATQGKPLL